MQEDKRRVSLVLLGGGGHASVVADAARAAGWSIAGFFDDEAGVRLGEVEQLGSIRDAAAWIASRPEPLAVHAAVGDGHLRSQWLSRFERTGGGIQCPAIIDPTAAVSPSASVAEAAFIGPRAVVNAGARIGRGTIINSGAIIEHDVRIGDFVHVAPGAAIGGEASIGSHTLIGIGATVLPGVAIGRHAVLGAGATLVQPLADNVIAMGVPARVMRTRA